MYSTEPLTIPKHIKVNSMIFYQFLKATKDTDCEMLIWNLQPPEGSCDEPDGRKALKAIIKVVKDTNRLAIIVDGLKNQIDELVTDGTANTLSMMEYIQKLRV